MFSLKSTTLYKASLAGLSSAALLSGCTPVLAQINIQVDGKNIERVIRTGAPFSQDTYIFVTGPDETKATYLDRDSNGDLNRLIIEDSRGKFVYDDRNYQSKKWDKPALEAHQPDFDALVQTII